MSIAFHLPHLNHVQTPLKTLMPVIFASYVVSTSFAFRIRPQSQIEIESIT